MIVTRRFNILSLLGSQQLEPVTGAHCHQPAAPVALVGDNRDFLPSIVNGLGHRVVDVEALDGFDLEMEPRQVRADHVRAVWRA